MDRNTESRDSLKWLDQRQDQVLSEIDELNRRIESALDVYLEDRSGHVRGPNGQSTSKTASYR